MNLLVLLIMTATLTVTAHAQQKDVCYNPNLVKDTSKKSIKSMAVGLVNGDSVKIAYHSPGVRERVIWGGLVPYGEIWVTGAHDATTLELAKPFIIGGKEIPAGKYAFFTIPGKKEWTVIINKNWKQHLAWDYDQKEDIVRLKVKPKRTQHTERLQYFVENTQGNDAKITVTWENKKV